MDQPLLMTTTVPERAVIPRRRMLLREALALRLCPTEALPVVDVTELTPARSMFDYDAESAESIGELPPGISPR
ncbi:MAG: hypothetical protein R2716_05570 [Microthrixaceae bacterium]